MNRAHVGMGSNGEGGRIALKGALSALGALPHTRLLRASSLYQSLPLGDPRQPSFLNMAVLLKTDLDPGALLQELLAIEGEAGRVPPGSPGRPGTRPLDLDLLSYGERVLEEPRLRLPHPRLALRTFVLVPLSEIDAFWNHPILGKTAAELLIDRSPVLDVRWLEPPLWNPS